MNSLIAINNGNIGGATVQAVNARDIHAFLEVGKDFSNWIKAQIKRARLAENRDYVAFAQKGVGGKFDAIEYHLTIEAGKHVSMMSGTDKGFEVRDYFIECERKAKAAALPQTFAEALRLAADQAEQLALMAPKAEFFDTVTGSNTAIDMALAAKTLNLPFGRNILFQILRDKGILDAKNIPYQVHRNAGYFRVVESTFEKPDGTVCVSFKTVVYQKGLDFIRRKLGEDKAA